MPLNSFTFLGRCMGNPHAKTNKNGDKYIEFIIVTKGSKNEDVAIPITCGGSLSQLVRTCCFHGNTVLVEGHIFTRTRYDRKTRKMAVSVRFMADEMILVNQIRKTESPKDAIAEIIDFYGI